MQAKLASGTFRCKHITPLTGIRALAALLVSDCILDHSHGFRDARRLREPGMYGGQPYDVLVMGL